MLSPWLGWYLQWLEFMGVVATTRGTGMHVWHEWFCDNILGRWQQLWIARWLTDDWGWTRTRHVTVH